MSFSVLKRGLATSACKNAIKNVTVIGGGLLGSGIAQVAAQTGHNVTLVEVNAEVLKKSELGIQKSLERVAKKLHKDNPSAAQTFISEAQSRIKGSTDPSDAVKDSDLVVEAILENMDTKQKLFKTLDAAAPPKTIFASNTSSLSITEIASVTNRKDKFGGLHFFNPPVLMQLLEVVKTAELSEDTYKTLLEWGKAMGKTCVTCKDTPGFIVNRLLVPYMAEAVRLVEEGVATPEDVDTAMRLGASYKMGPIELTDYVGVDLTKYILEGWHAKYPDNPLFKPLKSVDKLVAEGKFGRKTGEGFYKYNK